MTSSIENDSPPRVLRILILEDNPGDARLMAETLTGSGFSFEWELVSGREEFEGALEPRPDIILADFHIPGFGATEALELLAKKGLDLPLIVITGWSGGPKAAEAVRLGAVDYLRKDDLERLPHAVDRALAQKEFLRSHVRLKADYQKQERRYYSLFHEMLSGFALHEILCDGNGAPVDYRFLDINPAFEKLTGLTRGEVVGRTALEILPDLSEKWVEIYGKVALEGEPTTFIRYFEPLKKWFEVRAFPQENGRFATLFIDVTENQISLQKLRVSEEQNRAFFENSAVGTALVGPDLRFVKVNDTYCRMLGYTPEELLEMTPFDITHPDDLQADREKYLEYLGGDGSVYQREKRYVTKDGRIIWGLISASLSYDEEGRPLYSVGTIQDITQEKNAKLELQRTNKTLSIIMGCNQALLKARTEEELKSNIAGHLCDSGTYPLAMIWLIDKESREYARTTHPESAGDLFPCAEGGECETAGYLAESCRQHFSREVPLTKTTLCKGETCRRRLEQMGIRSCYSLALESQGENLGCLLIFSSEEGFFSAEVYLLKELADDLAYGIRSLRTERSHQQAMEMLHLRNQAIEASVNGIMISEASLPDTPLIYVNAAFEKITGFSSEEVLGRNPRFLSRDDTNQKEIVDIGSAVAERRPIKSLLRNYRKDGSLFWNNLTIAPVSNEAGEVTHFVSIIDDLTEQKSYEEELARRSNFDELTGLPNRNLLSDRINQAVAQSRRSGTDFGVFLLDLDRFQVINDSLGHHFGNELLKRVAERLEGNIRAQDTLARLGGDEFVILSRDVKQSGSAETIKKKIHAALAPPFTIGKTELQITASCGISLFPEHGEDEDTLIRKADLAMYKAKKEGGGTCHLFTEDLDIDIREIVNLEADLRRALEKDEFLLHLQPKVEVASGRIVGCEALVRWKHPKRGMVSPGSFIPLAEQTGLIEPLGTWVLREACRINRSFQERGFAPMSIAVNISARQFRNDHLVQIVSEALETSGLEPRWLDLELTESMVMDKPEQAVELMKRLKGLGVTLSLDDFGTGYSSLNYLRLFPVDRLKIDRSFINGVEVDPGSAAVAESIIAIAHNLRIEAVAEGVEEAEQLAFLRANRCDVYQGYFFSPPLPVDRFVDLLDETAGS